MKNQDSESKSDKRKKEWKPKKDKENQKAAANVPQEEAQEQKKP